MGRRCGVETHADTEKCLRLPMVIVALVLRLPIATSQVVARPVAPPVPNADSVAARDEFAWELLRKVALQKPDTNIVLAPLGISATMALVHEGARGKTATEMARTLRLTGPGDDPTARLDKLRPQRPTRRGLVVGRWHDQQRGIWCQYHRRTVRLRRQPGRAQAGRPDPGRRRTPTRAKPRLVESLARGGPKVKLQLFEYESGRVLDREIVLDRTVEPAAGGGSPMSLIISRAIWAQAGSTIEPRFQESPRSGTEPNCLRPTSAAPAPASPIDQHLAYRQVAWQKTNRVERSRPRAGYSTVPARPHDPARPLGFAFPSLVSGSFSHPAGAVESVPLMRHTGRFPVMRTERFDLLELPFCAAGLSFVAVLARNSESLEAFIKKTAAAELNTGHVTTTQDAVGSTLGGVVSFQQTLTVAHLFLYLHPAEVRALRKAYLAKDHPFLAQPMADYLFGEYSDRFFRDFLGTASLGDPR